MTRWSVLVLCLWLATDLLALSTRAAQEQLRFTATRHIVSVPVSVKERNRPVADLRVEEFRLWDSGVVQQVDRITFDEVPLDVTLFVDNSGSTIGAHHRLNDDLQVMVGLLTPQDRLRVLTFDWGVRDHFGWVPPGPHLRVETGGTRRGSPVHDAILTALVHRPDPGRRHLVVALTDGIDMGSIVGSARLTAVAERSDAVVHLVMFSAPVDWEAARGRVPPIIDTAPVDRDRSRERLHRIARDSGGANYATLGNTQQRFSEIIEDFRRSYVLHYSPTGVPRAGWHDLKVEVARSGRFTVRARRGYLIEE